MKKLLISVITFIIISLILVSCNDQKVIPNEKMFSVGIDELTNIHENQSFKVNGFLKNRSKYSWKINHGADMFTYQIYDENDILVPIEADMIFVNSIGFTRDLNAHGIFRYNGEEHRSNEAYEFTIKKAGKYKVRVTAKFAVQVVQNKFDQKITSDFYELIVN
jgi:hypothetical protein